MQILDKSGGPSIPGDANGGAGCGEKIAPPVRLCRFSHDGRQLAVVYDCSRDGCPNEVGRNCTSMSGIYASRFLVVSYLDTSLGFKL